MFHSPWIALAVTFVLALTWLRLNDALAQRGWISGPLSRKIIHTGTGPIFVLCWLLFPNVTLSRWLAALVPFAITVQFFLVGTGIWRDPAAVTAMSRSGDRREILRGPLFYGIVFVVLTLAYWKDSPIGIVALMLLCGGDGMADILGSRLITARLPWANGKTVGGSLAMLVGGWLFAIGITAAYTAAGIFSGPFNQYPLTIGLIALAGMITESLPFKDVDNLTVPAIAVLLGHLLF